MKRLILVLLAAILLLVFVTVKPVLADTDVNLIVFGPPPTTAPTIDEPTTGQVFNGSSITVTGTCITGLTVRIFRNTVFGGSSICALGGNYSIQMDLVVGQNSLVARQYDAVNQPSPDSNIVLVSYILPPVPPPINPPITRAAIVAQLILTCDYSSRQAFVGAAFYLPCQISGGIAPYAVSIDWGDGSSDVLVRDSNGNFVLSHIYKSSGNFLIKIKATDKNGSLAYLQTVASVGGRQDIFSRITAPLYQCKPEILWPLLALLLLILLILITSFKIGKREGERKELEDLRAQHRLKSPPKK